MSSDPANPRIPTQLFVGEIVRTTLDGHPVVVIGAKPSGTAVLFSEAGWRTLQQWKLTIIGISGGRVYASGKGYSGRPHAARVVTNTLFEAKRAIVCRNGNMFDLREENLAVLPASLIAHAKRQSRAPAHADLPNSVTLADGRVRGRRKPQTQNALQRYEAIVRGAPLPALNWRAPPSHNQLLEEAFERSPPLRTASEESSGKNRSHKLDGF